MCRGFNNFYQYPLTYCFNFPLTINLIIGARPSLHTNWHHQITLCKLSIIIEYPVPYERSVWDYNKSNDRIDWKAIFNTKSFQKQVSIFSKTLLNIFSNFILIKLVRFGGSDPAWMNVIAKNKIKWKKQLCKTCAKNSCKSNDYFQLQEATIVASQVILK